MTKPRDEVRIELKESARLHVDASSTEHDHLGSLAPTVLRVPCRWAKKPGGTRLLTKSNSGSFATNPDTALINALVRAWSWRRKLEKGEIRSLSDLARGAGVTRPYVSRILRLAYLAPDLIEAVLAGRQPSGLTLESVRDPIPLDWAEQRRLFGTDSA